MFSAYKAIIRSTMIRDRNATDYIYKNVGRWRILGYLGKPEVMNLGKTNLPDSQQIKSILTNIQICLLTKRKCKEQNIKKEN
jgi:hypothetical protein